MPIEAFTNEQRFFDMSRRAFLGNWRRRNVVERIGANLGRSKAWLFAGLFAVAPGVVWADLTGHVIKIADGDTLTVVVDKKQVRVRLDGIDAPEHGQAFGKRSRQSLADMCAAKQARVEDRGKDRYGRTIGRVNCAGIDANSEQLRRGMAWVFERYAPKDSPLYAVQAEARAARRGLWQDARPVPPWEWRANTKSN